MSILKCLLANAVPDPSRGDQLIIYLLALLEKQHSPDPEIYSALHNINRLITNRMNTGKM